MSMHAWPTPDEEEYPKDASTANKILGFFFILASVCVAVFIIYKIAEGIYSLVNYLKG